MASFSESPNPWASTSDTYKDCSQGICSIYCPQWCYIIFPPPPPFFDFAGDDGISGGEKSSRSDFSPLIIAVIGILGSAFILLTYYTIISKYCRRRSTGAVAGAGEIDGGDGVGQPGQPASFREGLEEGLIRSIRVYKYRSGDGFVDGADCAVCLSEFEENERLRLLPKCNHAFHVPCIDTWLKSHATCPLCRSDIAPFVVTDDDVKNEVVVVIETSSVTSNAYRTSDDVISHIVVVDENVGPKIDPVDRGFNPMVQRSASLNIGNRFCSERVLVADILRDEEDGEEEEDRENGILCFGIGTSSKGGFVDHDYDHDQLDDDDRCKYERSGAMAMRRSISTSRFVCSRHGKGNNALLPI